MHLGTLAQSQMLLFKSCSSLMWIEINSNSGTWKLRESQWDGLTQSMSSSKVRQAGWVVGKTEWQRKTYLRSHHTCLLTSELRVHKRSLVALLGCLVKHVYIYIINPDFSDTFLHVSIWCATSKCSSIPCKWFWSGSLIFIVQSYWKIIFLIRYFWQLLRSSVLLRV